MLFTTFDSKKKWIVINVLIIYLQQVSNRIRRKIKHLHRFSLHLCLSVSVLGHIPVAIGWSNLKIDAKCYSNIRKYKHSRRRK